jgi:phage tail sheath protein FI
MAPNYVSPGVYTVEKDISDFTPSINTSIVGIVGFASKGPTNKATLITDQESLVRTFGEPSEAINGQGLEGALEILEQTNAVYFIRCADDTVAVDASATVSIGHCPAIAVSGQADNTAEARYGIEVPVTLRIQVKDSEGVAKFSDNGGAGRDYVVNVPNARSQSEALRSVIGGALDADLVGVFNDGSFDSGLGLSGAIVGSFAGSGAELTAKICEGTTFNEASGIDALNAFDPTLDPTVNFGISPTGQSSSITIGGAQIVTTGSKSLSYLVQSLHPGAGYNGGVRANGDTSGNSITLDSLGSQNFVVAVNEQGVALETFKASLVASGAFLEDVINTGETNTTSRVIKGNIVRDGSDVAVTALTKFSDSISQLTTGLFDISFQGSVAIDKIGGRFAKLVGTAATNLAGGTNGIAATENGRATSLIGDATTEPKTGMQALDDDIINVGVALVPGVSTQEVQNSLITLAETTQDFMALVAPPYAVGTVQDAIDWTNGQASTTGSRTTAINSSFAAVHWPWVKVFSTFDGKDRWYDPSIFAARQMAYTDAVSDTWFAPAGFQRGRLTKPTEVEVKLNQGDRDSLYSGGNIVNPIVAFPQQGLTIFGQRTGQRTPTSLDRINVRRLMIYVRKVILASTQRFVFEPNDEFTWSQIEGVVNPFLDDIRRRRGITEFRVVCDETTNTPLRVDRNELWTKVLLKPTKTAEVIVFEINLTNQSADLGTL